MNKPHLINKVDWNAIFLETHRRFPWRDEAPPYRPETRECQRKSKMTSTDKVLTSRGKAPERGQIVLFGSERP